MKIKIDFDPSSEPSSLINPLLRLEFVIPDQARLNSVPYGGYFSRMPRYPRKQDVNYILARRKVDNDVCESLAKLANAAITRS